MKPYENLPEIAFWRTGVQLSKPTAMEALYSPKWRVEPHQKIATAGSCFAQHIARYMKRNGFTVLDVEPPPRSLPEARAKEFGYGLYSARYGNIYTVRQLLQLLREAQGKFSPADGVWEKEGRYFDALRPNIEPNGFECIEEVKIHRESHLRAIRGLMRQADVFVFTLGLTEAWIDIATGTVYPTAPGIIAGEFDSNRHVFKNFTFSEVYADLLEVRRILREQNSGGRLLLTVSPVPLTATASGKHVLEATVYSKSVLRAVAGQISAENEDVEYFPSFEIITNPAARSEFYAKNLRNVEESGVESVMRVFFNAHGINVSKEAAPLRAEIAADNDSDSDFADEDEAVCEEALLEAFAPGRS